MDVTNYPLSAYGSTNPNDGYPANGNTSAWGGYEWPNCPPASLQASTNYTNQFSASAGQVMKVSLRKEIVPLMNLAFQIADVKHKYPIWASQSSSSGVEAWGPWGGECRPISGTSNPSGHSKWLSTDINAPYNPYSYTFQSDIPPALVADWEALGLYWGGRYRNQKYDPMHFGFCRTPSTVQSYITIANNILVSYLPDPEDDMPLSNDDKDWIRQCVHSEIQLVMTTQYNVSDETSTPTVTKMTMPTMMQRAVTLGGHATAQTTQANLTKAAKAANPSTSV